jgi:hypothetical protein
MMGIFMQDRRAFQRTRTYLGAQVVFNSRFSTVDCLVRNLSGDGAKLTFSGTALIPKTIDVLIRNDGESRHAKIIWRTEAAAGVQFLQAGRNKVVSLEAARKIRRLEAEVAALARRIAEMVDPA